MKRKTLILAVLTVLLSYNIKAQESKFKALFIYKFAEYIEWPGGASNITIGVVGSDDVYDQLSGFASSKSIVDVIKINMPSDASKCQMIFLPKTENMSNYSQSIGRKACS